MAKAYFSFFHFIKKHTKNKLIIRRANKFIDNNSARIYYKYVLPINQAKDESKKDCELPVELARLLEYE